MTNERPPFPDYYEVLGVRPDATDAELRAVRREAAKRWHPDRNSGPDAEGMMRLVNEAWEVLGKPETRAEYDAVYFAWRAAEYARRATAADEVRRGYARERHEREAREAEERRAAAERASADVAQGEGRSGPAGHRDSDARDEGSDTRRDPVSGVSDRAIGVIFVGVIIVIGLVVAVAFARADRTGSGGSLSQSELATVTAIESEFRATAIAQVTRRAPVQTFAPSRHSLQSNVGDGLVECTPALTGAHKDFRASVDFAVPTSSEWSVGFRYHIGDDSRFGATTLIAQDRLIGVYSAHLTKKLGAEVHRIGPESVRSPSALKIDGGNTLQIEVNERGSYLILNGELQIHAPIAKLNPKSSPVGLCVGFFLGEASEYELQYWDMTGGAR